MIVSSKTSVQELQLMLAFKIDTIETVVDSSIDESGLFDLLMLRQQPLGFGQ